MNPCALFAATYTQSTSNPMNDLFMTLTSTAAAAIIVGFIIFIIGVIFLVRMWMVQTAIFGIWEEIHAIREHTEKEKHER